MNKLTPKQQAFVNEYLIDLNATQAAIRAGYSVKTAQMIGSENLSKPIIQEAVQQALDARADRVEITADNVLKEIATIAFAQINIDDTTIKTPDKLKGLEMLGRHLVLFSDKLIHEGELQVTKVVREVVGT